MSSRLIQFARRLAACLTLAGGALILIFWMLFLARVIIPDENQHAAAAQFEAAFPFADALLGTMLVLSGVGLLRKKTYGAFALVAAAGMTLYLGILDLTFYGRAGMYLPLTFSSVFLLFINGFCILGGALGLWFGWVIWQDGKGKF